MGSDGWLDDSDVAPIIDAFAKATQNACSEYEGLYEAIMSEAFEVFNEFCVKADPENTQQDNLRYFLKLQPKPPKNLKIGNNLMKRKKIPYGTKLPVKFTLHERDFIRDQIFLDPNFAGLAVVEGKMVRVELSLDDIEEIQGYVAAEANHTKNLKLRKELDRLFDKLQVFLDTYDDQDEIKGV